MNCMGKVEFTFIHRECVSSIKLNNIPPQLVGGFYIPVMLFNFIRHYIMYKEQ
jgi:hypothetical protein